MLRSIFILLLSTHSLVAQEMDSTSYTLFKDKIVLYTDLGFNSAPFNIKDDFVGGFDKLQYKHNLKATMGLGVIYKWFALRIGIALPGTLRNRQKFGQTNYLDLGLNFNLNKTYWALDLRNYKGYVIKDAYRWDDSLSAEIPHSIRPNTRSTSVSMNVWYHFNEQFRMPAVLGKVGHYDKAEGTFYLRNTLNIFGVGTDSIPLVSSQLIDTVQNKSSVHTISALDLGIIPGYAYVNRINNWQFSVFGGVGGVIQSKFLSSDKGTRGFLGVAPRFDLRLQAGYSKNRYFFLLVSEFDFKSISVQEMSYFQTYYTIRATAGIRLNKKKSKSRI